MKRNPALITIAVATGLLAFAPFAPAEPGLTEFPRWSGSQLEGTASPPLQFEVEVAYPQLSVKQIVDIDRWPLDETDLMVALDISGRVWMFEDDRESTTLEGPILEIPDAGPPGKRGGGHPQTYSLAFDPEFGVNFGQRPALYISSNRRDGDWGKNRVSRFLLAAAAEKTFFDPITEEVVIEWPSKGHNGCDLKFGADDMLYISSGDGDKPGDPNNVGQLTDNLLGSILRINIRHSRPVAPYDIPPDNPFIDTEGIRPEVWAYGLRNPWKMTFAPDEKTIYLGDNGDENWEMIRKVTAATNHGWSAFEGSHPFRLSNPMSGPVTELTVPAYEHPHSDMRSIIGGVFYQGEELPELKGCYLYGCYFTGKVWALDYDAATGALDNPRRIADTKGQLVAFSEDHSGEPLIVMLDGPVLRLKKREVMIKAKAIPAQLSATGMFSSTSDHQPAEGVLPYDINASSWIDGAEKTRWMAVPEVAETAKVDAPVGERLRKSWRFPNGSAFAQTLWFPDGEDDSRKNIETQIAHKDGSEWRFLTYRWREDQSDADLVDENGEDAVIEIAGKKMPWRFASQAECIACHTQRTFFVNAVSTEQMTRDFDYSNVGGKTGDQLETLTAIGLFRKGREPGRPNARSPLPPLVDPHDTNAPLDDRARSYLHVNCAHCHRETGLGGRAPFQLLHWLPLAKTGTINAIPMVGLPGVENARVLAPGAADRSELLRRMEAEVTGRMPLIGSRQLDRKGIDLIREWIDKMESTEPDTDAKPISK